ncbi:AAA family ATPase [Streptosporangium canum]|uniref:nSTAND1 domain-containing NTPase n=1 Tax=Streptosporangium canum TaxID=324952 RepID=UPI003678909D
MDPQPAPDPPTPPAGPSATPTADPGAESDAEPSGAPGGDGRRYVVDARTATGVQIGEGNTQIIYSYGHLTWSDTAAVPPLVDVRGAVDSPYRGLNAFQERDAAYFFGREQVTGQLMTRLSRQAAAGGLLMVSGVSGAGKSSLLRAGILPRLRGSGLDGAPHAARWPCLLFTPTRTPLEELAVRIAALAGTDAGTVRHALAQDPEGFALTARQAALHAGAAPGPPTPPAPPPSAPHPPAPEPDGQERAAPEPDGRRLVLLIDQFEQLFTQCADDGQRAAFVTALHAAATVGHGPDQAPAALVVLVVRADFEARCADYPLLAPAVQDRHLLTAMTERQLRLAITEPARQAGSEVEDDLVQTLLREIRTRHPAAPDLPATAAPGGAGTLPLLSHALDQAWRHRTGPMLTLADYERTGGIEGAVADSAQRVYDRLTPAQQDLTRQIFLRLATTGSDGTDTADRVPRAALTDSQAPEHAREVAAVLEAFAAERLLTLAADTVEISHEVLLRAWPLLAEQWLAQTHADRLIHTRLRAAAAEWAPARDPSYLYTGSLLETTVARLADPAFPLPLTSAERDFLAAGTRAQQRRTRRRRASTTLLVVLVALLTTATIFLQRSRQDTERERDAAIVALLSNQSETTDDSDPVQAKQLSMAASSISDSLSKNSPAALRAAQQAAYSLKAAAAHPGIAKLAGGQGGVRSVAFTRDGKILASGGDDGTVRLWDVTHRREIAQLAAGQGGVWPVAFTRDGKTLAGGGGDGTVQLWDVASGREIARLASDQGWVSEVAFTPDGRTLASGGSDGSVRLWDVTHRREIAQLTGHLNGVSSVAFTSDGKTLASGGSNDGTVRLWDVTHRREIAKLAGDQGGVWSVAFTRDGQTLASGGDGDGDGDGGTVRLWDVTSNQEIAQLTGHRSRVSSVAFTPDGKTLASGGDDGTVRLWDVTSNQEIAQLTGHRGGVSSVAFTPEGRTLASGGDDGTVRLWDVTHRREIAQLTGHRGGVSSVAFTPEGRTLASGGDDGSVRLWDVTHRREIAQLTGHPGGVWSVAFTRDGKTLASGGDDGSVRLWDVTSNQEIAQLTGHPGGVWSVAFTSDGKTLASGGDGTVRLWDVASGREIAQLTGHPGRVTSVALTPEGQTLASGGDDGSVRLWDVASGREIAQLTGHPGRVSEVAFTSDGKTLASGGFYDGSVRLWDVSYLVKPLSFLCSQVGRSFTPQEWERYVPPGPAYRKIC